MKKNRYFALILALALCIGMLAGCGSSSSDEEAAESSAEEAVVEEEAAAAEEEPAEEPAESSVEGPEEEEPGAEEVPSDDAPPLQTEPEEEAPPEEEWEYTPISYPLTDEDVVLDYWIIWELSPDSIYGGEVNDHICIERYKEFTGVTLNIRAQPQATGQTNTDLMIASGDYPDLIGQFSYATGMDAAIEDEVVVNIKDYIADWAPDYYRYLIADDYKDWKAVLTDEGQIGVFATVGTENEVVDGTMTFQFMLDDLGFTVDDLTTIDAYEEYLMAAKSTYGMASPLYLPGDFMLDGDTIANAFGVALKIDAITGDLPWIVEDGEVKFGYLEEGFTEYVELMAKWYDMGIIDSDTVSHPTEYMNDDQIDLIASKEIAIFHRGDGLIDMLAGISGETVVPIYFPTVNEGETLHVGGASETLTSETGVVVTTGCDDLQLAMNFLNYMYTDDYYIEANYGIEGTTFDFDENGEPQFQEWTWQTEGRTFSSVMMDYQIFTLVDANIVTPGQSEAALECRPRWNSNIDNANDFPDAAAMTISEADQYNQRAGDIVTLCQQYLAKFITGEYPISDIPEFQDMLYTTGIEDCIAAKQSAYDRYMSRE